MSVINVIVTEDAKVLTPNPKHRNFTETPEVIKCGTKLKGKIEIIEGLRKGDPFKYRIFRTNDNKIIYLNKTKPNMEKTEVTLGADSAQTPTVVKLPSTSDFGWKPVLGTIVGAVAAHFYIKKRGYAGTKKVVHYLIGAGVGFGIGYYIQSQGKTKVTPSK